MTQPGRPATPGGMQSGKAVLVIVVVVIVGWVILRHGTSSTHAAASSTTRPTTSTTAAPSTTTVPLVPPADIKLQVLNGVLTGSLAGEWSAKLKANPGYDTLTPLNATAKVDQSEIYIVTPGFQREANALAVAVGLPVTAVNVTVPPPASAPIEASVRTTANLVLVIGPDLASSA
jgi:LytR cell envelope-related transcriptional attenuator